MVKASPRCIIAGNSSFAKGQILESSKFNQFADDNFKCDENDRKFSIWLENTVGKGEIALVTSNFSFSHSIFKRLLLQTRETRACLAKG